MWTNGLTMIVAGAVLLLLGLLVSLSSIDNVLVATIGLVLSVCGAAALLVSRSGAA